MELITQKIPADCEIVVCGDFHYGALNCSKSSIREMVEWVGSGKHRYLINQGDSLESITPDDKRFKHVSVDYQNHLQTPQAQANAIVEDFKPIKDRILGWGIGNHEYKLLNIHDYGQAIAYELGCPYGAVMFKVRFLNEKDEVVFKTFHWHGSGKVPAGAKDPIQRGANRQAWLKRKLEGLCGDAIVQSMGHGHHSIITQPSTKNQLYMTDDGEKVKQHYRVDGAQNRHYIPPESRWYSMSPSFLKLFSPAGSKAISYGEIAGYEPTQIGYHVIEVNDYQVTGMREVLV